MLLFTLATAFRVNSMKVIMLKELKPMFPTPPGHELLYKTRTIMSLIGETINLDDYVKLKQSCLYIDGFVKGKGRKNKGMRT